MTKKKHTKAALDKLALLDKELASNAKRRGIPLSSLSWSAVEEDAREQIADLIDRREQLNEMLAAATDKNLIVRINSELRLNGKDVAQLMKSVKTDIPQPRSETSLRAQQAANARWDRERARNSGEEVG